MLSCLLYVTEVRDLFRTWRENSERQSRDVVYLWENFLAGKVNQLGNESKNSI